MEFPIKGPDHDPPHTQEAPLMDKNMVYKCF